MSLKQLLAGGAIIAILVVVAVLAKEPVALGLLSYITLLYLINVAGALHEHYWVK